jgi:signal peptidase I
MLDTSRQSASFDGHEMLKGNQSSHLPVERAGAYSRRAIDVNTIDSISSGSVATPGLAGAGIDVRILVRWLRNLKVTGTLVLCEAEWSAQLVFDRGRVIHANFLDLDQTEAAVCIEALFGQPMFTFIAVTQPHSGQASAVGDLCNVVAAEAAGRLGPGLAVLHGPTWIPRLRLDHPDGHQELSLTRAQLALLVEVNGQRSIGDLAEEHGSQTTLVHLLRYCELDLITLAPPRLDLPAASSTVAVEPHSQWIRTRETRESSQAERRGLHIRSILRSIVLVIALVIGIKLFVQGFRVDGASMTPTLSDGQVLLINKLAYARIVPPHVPGLWGIYPGRINYLFQGPRRGDIVVLRSPMQEHQDLIKRIIGLPGDSVLVRDGLVIVNALAIDEPYVQQHPDYSYPADGDPVAIPDGSFFVLGDNRPDSADSHLGWLASADDLIGQAWISYWPPSSWGLVSR